MKYLQQITIKVICEYNSNHIIEKDIIIQEVFQEAITSIINVYCPFCNKWINGLVQAGMYFDDSVLVE